MNRTMIKNRIKSRMSAKKENIDMRILVNVINVMLQYVYEQAELLSNGVESASPILEKERYTKLEYDNFVTKMNEFTRTAVALRKEFERVSNLYD